jgi:hypothetical protein
MPMGVLFWVLMILWLIFGLWVFWTAGVPVIGFNLLLFVVIGLLGWKVFGPVLQ